jgi:colicin import membrane protein
MEEAKRQAAAADAKRQAAAEEARKAAEEAKRKTAAEEAKRKAEEEARRKADEARKLAQELAAREQFLREAIARHAALIKQRVERYWSLPLMSSGNLSCTLRITMMPSGAVTSVQIAQSSGDSAFDNSAIAAVQKASPLPVPGDPDVLAKFRNFNFRFRPGG